MATRVDLNTGVCVCDEDGNDFVANEVVSSRETLGDGVSVTSIASYLKGVNSPLIGGFVDETRLSNLEPDGTTYNVSP